MFSLRFDMRAPSFGAPPADLYATALDMVQHAEAHGAALVLLSEHHSSADGYLPAPLTLASAMAARTATLPIRVSIFQLPLYHPIRLAEQIVVCDLISRGRVSYVGGLGYVPAEYEASGIDFRRRGKIADSHLDLLLRAITGEAFEHEGRRVHVTPAPYTPGGPSIAWGGGSLPAARRAGSRGLDFHAQSPEPELRVAYEEACRDNGHAPGFCHLPPLDMAHTVFVAEDVDAAWDELGPYLMHDVTAYAEWMGGNEATSISTATVVEQLRNENASHRIFTVDEAVEFTQAGGFLSLHPLIGGLPPELGWKYLNVVTDRVMPALRAAAPA